MNDNIRQYRGSGNHYYDIGTRGAETLGIGVRYSHHPNGNGYLIVRFVATGKKGVFTHFVKRESAQFLELPGGQAAPHSSVVDGARLNKLAIPVFTPPVYPHEVLAVGDSLNVWPVVGQWIHTQAELDGFTVTADIPALLRTIFTPPTSDMGTVKLALEFPDLAEFKAQHGQHHPHPVAEPDDDDNDPDEGGDEDEDDGDDDDDEVVN